MKEDLLNSTIESIKSKLGEENSAIISDDLGILITNNTEALKELQEKDNSINDLKDRNEKLITANGRLLQQIPMGTEQSPKQEEKTEPFNFRSLFDEKGNWKK